MSNIIKMFYSVFRLIGTTLNCLHYNHHLTMWYKNNQSDHIFSQFEWTFLLPLSLLFVLVFHTLSYLLPSVSQWPIAEWPLLLLFWQHCFLKKNKPKQIIKWNNVLLVALGCMTVKHSPLWLYMVCSSASEESPDTWYLKVRCSQARGCFVIVSFKQNVKCT